MSPARNQASLEAIQRRIEARLERLRELGGKDADSGAAASILGVNERTIQRYKRRLAGKRP